ncbi:hypothetical protein [Aeoliella straminimaris]|nr:hypothetical protein [Aeoliella straminimaris]
MTQILAVDDTWPNNFDMLVLLGYVALVVGVPAAGLSLLVIDIRAHYRRLKGALVVVSNYVRYMPSWVADEAQRRKRVPPCLAVFGLKLPCTEAELLKAYREMVKERHPDLGGDMAEFLQLQRFFEEARSLITNSD